MACSRVGYFPCTSNEDDFSTNATTDVVVRRLDGTGRFVSVANIWIFYITSGCDLQRLIGKNIVVKHCMAIVSFFFLFSVIDQSNKSDVGTTWLKTILVYLLFMMSIKSKNIASVSFVMLLIVDQTIKLQMDYKTQKNDTSNMDVLRRIRTGLFAGLVGVAVVGFVFYFMRQYADHYDDFSFLTFFFGSNTCNDL